MIDVWDHGNKLYQKYHPEKGKNLNQPMGINFSVSVSVSNGEKHHRPSNKVLQLVIKDKVINLQAV